MGNELTEFYQDRIQKRWKTAFYSAFFLGLLIHIYKFTNLLPNHDGLYNFYSSQNMVASGRWFLSIACCLGSFFDLPWVNGILSLVFMGLTAAVIADIFDMENPCLIVLSSGLLVSFPAITATMAYEFTADGYMIAMFLAALSVRLTRMDMLDKKHWKSMVCSGICICLACSIYQAYVSFAFLLAVCYFMTELLENRREEKKYWQWIGLQIVIYGLAMAAYYLIWKICLRIQGFAAASYQGIDQVGTVNAWVLLGGFRKILRDTVRFFLEWNILEHGVTRYSVLNILFLLAFSVALAVSAKKSEMKWHHILLLVLCVAAIPIGGFLWYLTSPDVFYHALMLQSLCLIYIITAVLYERWMPHRIQNLALILLMVIVFNNSVTANIYYSYMDQSFRKTQAVAAEVSTRIHLLDDGTVRYVALCGGLDDWKQEDYFAQDKLRQLGGWKTVNKTLLSPMFLSLYTDFDLYYYRCNGLEYPVVENEPGIPAPQNWEFRFPTLSTADILALSQTEQVRNMPIWPARDSVQVLGDTIVVKLSEPEINS